MTSQTANHASRLLQRLPHTVHTERALNYASTLVRKPLPHHVDPSEAIVRVKMRLTATNNAMHRYTIASGGYQRQQRSPEAAISINSTFTIPPQHRESSPNIRDTYNRIVSFAKHQVFEPTAIHLQRQSAPCQPWTDLYSFEAISAHTYRTSSATNRVVLSIPLLSFFHA